MRLYLLLFLFIQVFYLNAQISDVPTNPQPGKCYAKCNVNTYERSSRNAYSIPVFTGTDSKGILLDTIELDVKPVDTKWVKKKMVEPSILTDKKTTIGHDMDAPNGIYYIVYVVDTLQTDEYSWENFDNDKKQITGNRIEWVEVLCGDKVTTELIGRIGAALIDKGYDLKKWRKGDIMIKDLKEALTKYQKDHNLPVGSLDFDTLESLGQ
jgi:hypothetical protein